MARRTPADVDVGRCEAAPGPCPTTSCVWRPLPLAVYPPPSQHTHTPTGLLQRRHLPRPRRSACRPRRGSAQVVRLQPRRRSRLRALGQLLATTAITASPSHLPPSHHTSSLFNHHHTPPPHEPHPPLHPHPRPHSPTHPSRAPPPKRQLSPAPPLLRRLDAELREEAPRPAWRRSARPHLRGGPRLHLQLARQPSLGTGQAAAAPRLSAPLLPCLLTHPSLPPGHAMAAPRRLCGHQPGAVDGGRQASGHAPVVARRDAAEIQPRCGLDAAEI